MRSDQAQEQIPAPTRRTVVSANALEDRSTAELLATPLNEAVIPRKMGFVTVQPRVHAGGRLGHRRSPG